MATARATSRRRCPQPQIGIQSGNIPDGASVSLFMFPILALAAFFVLRGVTKRTKEIAA